MIVHNETTGLLYDESAWTCWALSLCFLRIILPCFIMHVMDLMNHKGERDIQYKFRLNILLFITW